MTVGRVALIVALLAVTVAGVSANECAKQKGVCQDYTKKGCQAGTYVKGLCPGTPAAIRCCVPAKKAAAAPAAPRPAQPTQAPPARPATPPAQAPPAHPAAVAPAAPAAAKCSGKCQDKGLPCGAAYQTGLCPGSSSNQCCPKPIAGGAAAAPAAPTAPAAPAATTAAGKWSAFSTIWQKYPHGEAADVKRRIGGKINADWVTNTCVVRVTRALTEAGMAIKPFMLAKGEPMLLVSGGNGVGLGVRVKEFSEYVLAKFGKPQVKVVNAGDGTAEIPQQFVGKKGLIKFDVKVWTDATGHFDLWDGEACAHNCYFDKAKEVWLWEIA